MQEAKSLNYTKTVFYQNIKGSANFLFYFVPYKLYLICVALKGRGKKVFESIYHGLRTSEILTGGGCILFRELPYVVGRMTRLLTKFYVCTGKHSGKSGLKTCSKCFMANHIPRYVALLDSKRS